jgi:hypothetical protein
MTFQFRNIKTVRENLVATKDPVFAPVMLSDLEQFVPSIVAAEPHGSRSERYGYVSTLDILMQLRDRFSIVQASQSRVRNDASRRDYTKHMVRLRQKGVAPVNELGGLFPELVLINSHDGSSSYQLMAGLFRLVCSNGMVMRDTNLGDVRIQHKANAASEVIDASYTVIENAAAGIERARDWARIELHRDEQMALAEEMHALRFEPGTAIAKAINPVALLAPRRIEDTKQDLWSVANRVQENVIKGGLFGTARGEDKFGRTTYRSVRSRVVGGVDQDVKLNKALWSLAEKMAELKQAA